MTTDSSTPVAALHGAEAVAWDLSDLYGSADEAGKDLDACEIEAAAFAGEHHGRIALLDAPSLAAALKRLDAVQDRLGRVQTFAFLRWSADTQRPEHGAFLQTVRERSSRLAQLLLFFELEWMAIDEPAARRLLESPELSGFRHYLEVQRLLKKHVLTEAEEKILAEKAVTGSSAWGRFFDEMLGRARFSYRGQSLSEDEVLAKLHETDRAARAEAARSLTEGLRLRLPELTFVFNTALADKASEDRLRGYETWLSARNLANEISGQTVQALIAAVIARYDLVARYYRLKGKLLGISPLEDFDRYAPVPGRTGFYRWEEARDTVVSAYEAFHPEFGAIARRFFEGRWIDAAVRSGKRGGAFSHGAVPSAHPYILMNYTGRPRDVQTLAHELGHGIHQYLSRRQGVFQSSTPLTMAETASVFGETLAFRRLIRQEQRPEARLSMLLGKIDDTMATVFRQVTMNRFEERIHTARREQGELSAEDFGRLWMETQEAMFGGSVRLNDHYSIWWSYIPHFIHTPGYVYAYAFGELLVLSLVELYDQEGEEFGDKYVALLTAGGSDWPGRLLEPFGVDLDAPAFWTRGLTAVERLIEQAEELAG
jgi:oligoendopeptidase F